MKILGWCVAALAIVALVVVLLSSTPIVSAWGIRGAAILYISSMVLLSLWFGVLFWRDVRRPGLSEG